MRRRSHPLPLTLCCLLLTAFASAQEAAKKPPFAPRLDLPDVRQELMPLIDACGVKKPAKPPKLLVFWKCEGFAHAQAIETAVAFYQGK